MYEWAEEIYTMAVVLIAMGWVLDDVAIWPIALTLTAVIVHTLWSMLQMMT